jgi:hypothetical protein
VIIQRFPYICWTDYEDIRRNGSAANPHALNEYLAMPGGI